MGSRHLTLGVVAAVMGCSLLYSSYDGRFGGGSTPPLVTDDGGQIQGIALSSDAVFFYLSASGTNAPTIKRVALDGGGLSTWWTGDASVNALTSDGTSQLAWIAGTGLWVASASSPSTATPHPPASTEAYK